MVLHGRLLFAFVRILFLHLTLLLLEHLDVLAVAIEIVMGLLYKIVVHHEVIQILWVLGVQTFLVLRLFTNIVVCMLEVLETSNVSPVV